MWRLGSIADSCLGLLRRVKHGDLLTAAALYYADDKTGNIEQDCAAELLALEELEKVITKLHSTIVIARGACSGNEARQ
jgi:hypothetical protein